jgi:hypothetical protein
MATKAKRELDSSQTKKTFEEPKLEFLRPMLTKHGDATKITHQVKFKNKSFFGSF